MGGFTHSKDSPHLRTNLVLPDHLTLARAIHRTVTAIRPGTEHIAALKLADMATDCVMRWPLITDMPSWRDGRFSVFLRLVTDSGLLVPAPASGRGDRLSMVLIGSADFWDLGRTPHAIAISRTNQWEFVKVGLPT